MDCKSCGRRGFIKAALAASAGALASPLVRAAPRAGGRVMLGIDVLESLNYRHLRGKRVGLLTNPAGVNRFGKSTVDVLRSARGVRLTALFGPEHGIYGDEKADVPVLDKIDRRTRLPVYSLYGKYRKPTSAMLSKIDALVVDLQDIGSRSYTYVSCMVRAMEACFENGKEIVVLDRPNPLGGLKVDGPMLDRQFKSYVGQLQVPYVHAMTIGELACFAKGTPGALDIPKHLPARGRLTVVPMRGWKRRMTWTDTGLKWIPTSPAIPSLAAAMGYAMTGLGAQVGGFQHGYGTQYPFRLLTFPGKSAEQIASALGAYRIRGISFSPVEAKNAKGARVRGAYVVIDDWDILRPTEISFYMMKLACRFGGGNVFRGLSASKQSLFNKHTGSEKWWREISSKGAAADARRFVESWSSEAFAFQKNTLKYRLY